MCKSPTPPLHISPQLFAIHALLLRLLRWHTREGSVTSTVWWRKSEDTSRAYLPIVSNAHLTEIGKINNTSVTVIIQPNSTILLVYLIGVKKKKGREITYDYIWLRLLVCVGREAHAEVRWQTQRSSLPWDQIQAVRRGGKGLHQPSHSTSMIMISLIENNKSQIAANC